MSTPLDAYMLDNPKIKVSQKQLQKIGVLYWHFDPNNYQKSLEGVKKRRGYSYEDTCHLTCDTPDLEKKKATFFEEHIHRDEEIRFFLEGSGYFDVRGTDEKWIRIHGHPGDLIVLPAGIYHRFALDEKNVVRVLRLFVGEPVWTPYNRSKDTEDMKERKDYAKFLRGVALSAEFDDQSDSAPDNDSDDDFQHDDDDSDDGDDPTPSTSSSASSVSEEDSEESEEKPKQKRRSGGGGGGAEPGVVNKKHKKNQ